MPFTHVQDAVELMRMEYAEMPDLQLTFWQAQRLWNLSDETCGRALGLLIGAGFLVRTADGPYCRPALISRAEARRSTPPPAVRGGADRGAGSRPRSPCCREQRAPLRPDDGGDGV